MEPPKNRRAFYALCLATLGVVMARGGTIAEGCQLAVQIAGRQVGQIGVGGLDDDRKAN